MTMILKLALKVVFGVGELLQRHFVFSLFSFVEETSVRETLWKWLQKLSQTQTPKVSVYVSVGQPVMCCDMLRLLLQRVFKLSSAFSFKNWALHTFMLHIRFPIGTLEIGYKAKSQLAVSMVTAGSKGDHLFALHRTLGWNTEPQSCEMCSCLIRAVLIWVTFNYRRSTWGAVTFMMSLPQV